mgnify:CR=1 FL=1
MEFDPANDYKDCSVEIKRLEALVNKLNNIGVMLSAEKNTDKLLDMILAESMEITSCDAASIYVKVEKDGRSMLQFKNTRNYSREFPFNEFFMPIDENSISGYCAYSGQAYNFMNMDDVPRLIGIKYNDFFDKKINYQTTNMMVIPMKDIKGEVEGVVQLINKKKDGRKKLMEDHDYVEYIVPFTTEEESILLSLASQTAVLLERTRLMDEIQILFDSFVESMVTTIEKRDPTTSGHSIRVAKYVKEFALAVNRVDYGKYGDVHFTEDEIKELHYSGLLHDVGKIGVSESVLQKENRLTVPEIRAIQYRFNYVKKDLALRTLQGTSTEEENTLLENIDDYCQFVTAVNTKGFLPDEEEAKLRLIASYQIVDFDNITRPLLDESEMTNLTVKKGNLTNADRDQMNQHAEYTYQILKDIPWIKNLSFVPKIAAAHHEKLDGTGYPNRLKEDEITLQSKMLAIIDIFEALTAIDRPYKKAMPVDKALKILEEEATFHHVDKDLFEIFVNERLYETCLNSASEGSKS